MTRRPEQLQLDLGEAEGGLLAPEILAQCRRAIARLRRAAAKEAGAPAVQQRPVSP